jgi:hypothetical protein
VGGGGTAGAATLGAAGGVGGGGGVGGAAGRGGASKPGGGSAIGRSGWPPSKTMSKAGAGSSIDGRGKR